MLFRSRQLRRKHQAKTIVDRSPILAPEQHDWLPRGNNNPVTKAARKYPAKTRDRQDRSSLQGRKPTFNSISKIILGLCPTKRSNNTQLGDARQGSVAQPQSDFSDCVEKRRFSARNQGFSAITTAPGARNTPSVCHNAVPNPKLNFTGRLV